MLEGTAMKRNHAFVAVSVMLLLVGAQARTNEQLKTKTLLIRGIRVDFVSIPAGEFLMGSESGDILEKPAHRVHVGAFELAATEVTRKLFDAFAEATGYKTTAEKNGSTWMRDLDGLEKGGRPWRMAPVNWRNPGFPQSDNDPVVCISWNDAVAFCEWAAKETGAHIRLPAEAEWEYACRAGTTGDHYGNLDEIAWYRENSGGRTHPVRQKKPNAWGLCDMQGNAWEWCSGTWTLYEGAPKEGGPEWLKNTGLDLQSLRPLRGGAWGLDRTDYRSGDLRASSRVPYPNVQSCNNSGFRLASSQK
jgi:formylglycine-generating enzyme required for sulfatase activity